LWTSGVDLSHVAARRACAGSAATVANAEQLPFRAHSFDRVTCLGSLEHFPHPELGAAEISRVLRPEGLALIFVPNLLFLGHLYFGITAGTEPSEGGQHFSETFHTIRGWEDVLAGGGLRVVGCYPWNRMYATRKVPPLVVRAWNAASALVPLTVAYAYAFICAADAVPLHRPAAP
jgi:SAM-dependent methyltransferase